MKNNDNDYLNNLRHSTAHLLAAAVIDLWPNAKRTIRTCYRKTDSTSTLTSGETKISEDDLPKIEAKMHDLLPSWKSFDRHELSPDKAKAEYPDNPYKHELIDEFSGQGETLSFYKSGDYWDLCRGGHCEHPNKELKHFKLLKVAGAYWRGVKNKMLTRIYGTCFPSKEELDKHLWQQEEAKKARPQKIGKQQELFLISQEAGSGFPIYQPKDFSCDVRSRRG